MKQSGLKISKDEVLRYLGYKNQIIDNKTLSLINECREEIVNIITPRTVYEYKKIYIGEDNVKISDTNLILKGNDIKKHLKDSKECVLMAATLGNDIEMKIRLYQRSNLTKGLIMDACATTAIEEVCDELEEIIRQEAHKNNKNITFRYSPGYGDLSLDIQSDFLNVLNAQRRIGLVCSENNLLFPRKSVTAIIGIVDKNIKIEKKSCSNCDNFSSCNFRKEGKNCGA